MSDAINYPCFVRERLPLRNTTPYSVLTVFDRADASAAISRSV